MNNIRHFVTSVMINKYESFGTYPLINTDHINLMISIGGDILNKIYFNEFVPECSFVLPSGIHTIFVSTKRKLESKLTNFSITVVNELMQAYVYGKYNKKLIPYTPVIVFTCSTKIISPHILPDKTFKMQLDIWKKFVDTFESYVTQNISVEQGVYLFKTVPYGSYS